ncbi:sigma-70 family RNA polymerase sigma factor [Verrucomicrobia bacterium]|nr:sigma-70 family RNA polymerase sigma factor [Verrucomicrobiota bacterium]
MPKETAKNQTTKDENVLDRAEETRLIERTRSGDLAAYGELIRYFQPRVYATVYNMTSNHEDAADLTQEALVKAFQSLKSFKGQSGFYTWVYRIAINKTINYLKKHRRRKHISLNDVDSSIERDSDFVALISNDTPRRDMKLTELQEKLNEAMQILSEKHRLVVVLHDIDGVPHEEIARMTNSNVGTVRSRLFYARQQLQAKLSEYLT